MLRPFATPVETNRYQLVSAPQWPIMKTTAKRIPPASAWIRRALPTESHQIQKYGLAALVRSPAAYGPRPPAAGAALMLAVRLPAIVIAPKTTSAMPPMIAIAVVYGCAIVASPRTIRKKIAVSITMWPRETFSPAFQSPPIEALMVATSV